MSFLTYAYRFVVAKVVTIIYSTGVILLLAYDFFKRPRNGKKILKPPACLTDPKYGVHKEVKANNIKLHYVESGDSSKPLMIFVHGFPEFWFSWRQQIVEFNKDYWCIAVDMRGYGGSERPKKISAYHIDVLIEDLRDLIRQLGREKCIIVAHDWGGIISCRFRDVYPDVLDGIVLLASCSHEAWFHEMWNNYTQFIASWYVFVFQVPVIPELLMQIGNLNLFRKALMVKGKDGVTEEDIECYKYWFGKRKAFAIINYYRANFLYTVPAKKFDKAEIPFLAALGENDPALKPRLHAYMKKEYAHIETVIVKNCGHFMQQEEPARVNKMIREFLAKHKL